MSEDGATTASNAPIGRVARRLGWRARLDLGIAAFGRPVGAAMATFGVVGAPSGVSTSAGGGTGNYGRTINLRGTISF